MSPLDYPALPCPECKMRGHGMNGEPMRIGNRRSRCTTCNNFAQNVMRLTRKRLADEHPIEYARVRRAVEADLYPGVLAAFNAKYPPEEATL